MLKVAVVGAGTMGVVYARAFAESGLAEVVAVVDRDLARARASAAEVGAPRTYVEVDDLIAGEGDLDAVALAVPDFAHADPAIALLERDISVLCEKPLATTLEDCARIEAAVENSRGKFMVNYGNRHRSESLVLRQVVQSGDLGPLVNVTMKGNEKLSKTRTLAWSARTNPTLFLISHLVDFVTWTTGERFTSVFGASAEQVDKALPVPPATSYIGRLEGGALVTLASCWTLPEGLPSTGEMAIEIVGASGATRLDFAARPVEVHIDKARNLGWDFATRREDGILHGWWIDACRYFLQSVVDGTDPEPSLQTALETNFVLEAMTRSLSTGQQVFVDEVRTEYANTLLARS